METVNLGRSGLKVSRLCLGTMIFGRQVSEETAFAVLDKALERPLRSLLPGSSRSPTSLCR